MAFTQTKANLLAEELAKLDEQQIRSVLKKANVMRADIAIIEQEEEELERIEKISKRSLDSISKRINNLKNSVSFELKVQPTITIKGEAVWTNGENALFHADVQSVTWNKEAEKAFQYDNLLASAENEITQLFRDLSQEFGYLIEDDVSGSIFSKYQKLNRDIEKVLTDLEKLEIKHNLSPNALWNYLVSQGKIQ